MVIVIDVGDVVDIYLCNKCIVGQCLVVVVMYELGLCVVLVMGLCLSGYQVWGDEFELWFDIIVGGLCIVYVGEVLCGFYLVGVDCCWVLVEVCFDGDCIVLCSLGMIVLVVVCYVWVNNVSEVNVVGGDGLLLMLLCIDDWFFEFVGCCYGC